MQVDGHRADLIILKASRAHAAFEGRTSITPLDIALAAELALPHRVKAGIFRQSEMGLTELQDQIEQLKGASTEGTPAEEDQETTETESAQKKTQSPPISRLAANPQDPSL